MKPAYPKTILMRVLLSALILMPACKDRDTAVKGDLTAKAKENMEFAGVTFTVENGVVTLNGSSPTADMRLKLEDKVRQLYGVKDVISNIRVAPVTIGTDRQLKLSVDSVLQDYPAVQAIVADSAVLLQGKVDKDKAARLLAAVQSLKPRALENRMEVR